MGFDPTCCKELARIPLDVGERVGKTAKGEVPDKLFHLRTCWALFLAVLFSCVQLD